MTRFQTLSVAGLVATRGRSETPAAGIDFAAALDPAQYVGRAPEQVDEFLGNVIAPIRAHYPQDPDAGAGAELRV